MKSKKYRLFKVLPAHSEKNEQDNGVLRLAKISSPKDADNIAYFTSGSYENIFGKKRKEDSFGRKKLAVVKIQYKDNPPIYRAYESAMAYDFDSTDIGLSPSSIRLLDPEGELNPEKEDYEVTVEVGTQEDYLKYHPDIIVSTAYNTNQELLKAHDRLDVATDDIRKAQKKLDESSRFSTRLAWVSIVLGIVSVIASWENMVKIGKSVINCIQSFF